MCFNKMCVFSYYIVGIFFYLQFYGFITIFNHGVRTLEVVIASSISSFPVKHDLDFHVFREVTKELSEAQGLQGCSGQVIVNYC